jgi:opacity protein-like surface antigen
VIVAGSLLLGPLAARAQFGPEQIGKLSVGVRLGGSTYAMDGVNSSVGVVNQYLDFEEIAHLDNMKGGFSPFGVVRFRVTRYVGVMVEGGKYSDESDIDVTKGTLHLEVKATPIIVSGYYYFPFAEKINALFRFYAGGGIVRLNDVTSEVAIQDLTPFNPDNARDLSWIMGSEAVEATGSGFQVFVGTEYFLAQRLSLGAELNYRRANAKSLTVTEFLDATPFVDPEKTPPDLPPDKFYEGGGRYPEGAREIDFGGVSVAFNIFFHF